VWTKAGWGAWRHYGIGGEVKLEYRLALGIRDFRTPNAV
jgi:hypothetical protein